MKHTHRWRGYTLFALTGLFCLISFQGSAVASPPQTPLPAEANLQAEYNLDGLRGNRTRVSEMILALHGEINGSFIIALYTLARLGATEALPDMDAMPRKLDVMGKVCRARLVVEAAHKDGGTQQTLLQSPAIRQEKALTKMRALLSELNLDAERINAAIAAYKQDKVRVARQEWPLETYALNHLADIAYQYGVTPDKQAQDIASLDFSQVPPAALKMQLAPLSSAQRVAWLLDDLTGQYRPSLAGGQTQLSAEEMQLLLDEGIDVGPAIATRLEHMRAHPEKYQAVISKPLGAAEAINTGERMLIQLLEFLGDNRQAPVLRRIWREEARKARKGDLSPAEETVLAHLDQYLAHLDQYKRVVRIGY